MKMLLGEDGLASFSKSFIEYMLSRLEELELEFDDIKKIREEDLNNRARDGYICPKEEEENSLKIVNNDGNENEMTHLINGNVPFIDESNIYGRDGDEKNLVEELLKSEKQVIVLLGMGGLGKTTLAKKLCRNKDIECHFAMRIWVFVSNDFDIKRITKDALNSATQKNCSFNVFSVIQEELQKLLKGKRFFLVLDDVWIENQYEWECLGFLSNFGSEGSKILVTTRSRIVAKGIYPTMDYLIYELKKLDDNDSLKLFQSYAYYGLDYQKREELKNMSMEIVKMCYGLPLLINVIGKLLLNTNGEKEKWRIIIKNDAWKKGIILNTYKISYDNLSNHLKQCFVYCSVFPKRHKFGRSELAKLWIAQGLVEDGASKPIKEVETEYVDGLLHRSLLQKNKGHWCEDKYSMHDIMHYLAKRILLDEKSMGSKGVRKCIGSDSHQNNDDSFEVFNECVEPIVGRTHHSLYPKPKDVMSTSCDVNLKRMRVMICETSYFDTISNSIGGSKHLRYLNIMGEIPSFPKAICQLYNLQTIHLDLVLMYYQYFEFPKDIKNLKKLQHIYISPRMKLTSGIGELDHIQTLLPKIGVTKYDQSCTISELGNLSRLGGTLVIKGLEKLTTVNEQEVRN
ncbi:NB-ARC domain-containing disease resistance protein [Zostera marina]|uniref:NB-ARC domain-containing disease resistance protein n=1 Tax=Zostera marina TaxID=29655 RepID=A0A0K9Q2S8_ZOSMR|nr:NB-ARC domain-containing disease resistance protein [Zostera marina]